MWAWLSSSLLVGAVGQVTDVERRVEERVARLASEDEGERSGAAREILDMDLEGLDALARYREHENAAVRARVQDLVRQLRGVEGEEYGEPIVVTIPAETRNGVERIRSLCAQASWPLDVRPRAPLEPADMEPRLLSFFEAVDEAARAAGGRARYELNAPVAEAPDGRRYFLGPRIELVGREGPELPVDHHGPVRIAVESVQQERVWGGAGDRWEVRIVYSVAWQPNVQALWIENVVERAETERGEPLVVREPQRFGEDGSRCVVLEGRATGERLRLRGRVRMHVPDVLARGSLVGNEADGAEVHLGLHAFTVREGDRGVARVFELLPARAELLASAERVWARWVGDRAYRGGAVSAEFVAPEDGGPAVRVTSLGERGGSLEVGIVLRSRAVDHPYDWDLPFPAFWPGSE